MPEGVRFVSERQRRGHHRGILRAPNAVAYVMNEDRSISVNKPGILVNGSDPDGDKLEARLVEGPKHGKLKLVEDGSFEYKPEKNYDGKDGFSALDLRVSASYNSTNDSYYS